MYTIYAPPAAIAKPINMTQTAVHADFPSVAVVPADQWNKIRKVPCASDKHEEIALQNKGS